MPDLSRFDCQKRQLAILAEHPPQTVLIEGAGEPERLALALHWAKSLNCARPLDGSPCLDCAVCKQIEAYEFLDVLLFDGRISNRQDEEKPGRFKALRMENARDLKSLLATEPAHARKRVVIFQGLANYREEALNSLLKTLEEPIAHTCFVLLAPLREQILPTLVSRSFCIMLPWLAQKSGQTNLGEELALFLRTGKGFLNTIAAKGAIDEQSATNLLLSCQRALAQSMVAKPGNGLEDFFFKFCNSPNSIFTLSRWFIEAQRMILAGVNPARVLESLFSNVHQMKPE